eukprot:135089-Heterocapsa_arctica.AAC.1
MRPRTSTRGPGPRRWRASVPSALLALVEVARHDCPVGMGSEGEAKLLRSLCSSTRGPALG